MNTLVLDLEWGYVYGSYKRHAIPYEAGSIIFSSDQEQVILQGRQFPHDIDMVVRRNTTDERGKTTGSTERVVNVATKEYQKSYDPAFKLSPEAKTRAKRITGRAIAELGSYISSLLSRHAIRQLVVFGGNNDIILLKKGGVRFDQIEIIDLQHLLRRATGFRFSLDKISHIVDFTANAVSFGTNRKRYPVPEKYRYLVKPHRAIGDACRIFTIYQEFQHWRDDVISACKAYITAHERPKKPAPPVQPAPPAASADIDPERRCPQCQRPNVISFKGGRWCPHCGRYVVLPDPSLCDTDQNDDCSIKLRRSWPNIPEPWHR